MKEKLLLVAEKPSLMRELKNVYDKNKSSMPYTIDFISLAGHVCGYALPSKYETWDKSWQELSEILPMIPDKWKIDVMQSKKDIFQNIKDRLSQGKYDGLICATDSDREGNLIFYLLENKLQNKKKVYRIWIHDLTDKAIKDAYANMVDFHKDTFQKNLTYASILRSRFDWLVGMNYSVAASVKSGMTMKMGRVKTPTLKMVYDNSMAIDNFVPKTTYLVDVTYKEGFHGNLIENNEEKRFETKEDAEAIIKTLPSSAKIVSYKKEKTNTMAPALYKLSDLQTHANKLFGYSVADILAIVQSLYEKKILSYPRTDCRFVSEEAAKDFGPILESGKNIPELIKIINAISPDSISKTVGNKKYVNDKEVNKSSHTALIPTGQDFDFNALSEKERNILKTVYIRFVSIFMPPLIEEKTTILADAAPYTLKTNGKVVVSKGWSELVGKNTVDLNLPDGLKEGDMLHIEKYETRESVSTPPARLTEGELINRMENVAKFVKDEKLKRILKESEGIGTPSSRASIISSLIADNYVETKKSKKTETLFISEKGKQYIENIIDLDITSPELTAVWEDRLKAVERGELDSVEFSDKMKSFLNENIKTIKTTTMARTFSKGPAEVIGKCPKCGCEVIENSKAFSCVGYKNDPPCKFTLWKENALLKSQHKKLTKTMVKSLLKNGKCHVKGLVSKSGKKYDADFILEDTEKGVNLKIKY